MPKSFLGGYLTEGCRICPYWMDGSNPDFGAGCGTPFPYWSLSFLPRHGIKRLGPKA